MTFKDDVQSEIRSVFLNPDEFGEYCEIAGHEDVACVVTDLVLDMTGVSEERPGLSYEGVTVYVDARDVPEQLLTQKAATFRGQEWYVLSCGIEMGLKKIQLYRERA